MIRLNDLSFRYGAGSGGDGQLNNINLHVTPGEFVILTGSSGCGKTTLTRVLNGLCPQFYPGTLTGSYELNGRDATKITISELGTMIGSVFQDPRSQFYATNTTDEIVLGRCRNVFQNPIPIPRNFCAFRMLRYSSATVGKNLSIIPIPMPTAFGRYMALSAPIKLPVGTR